MKITIDHRLFNPLFWHVVEAMQDKKIRYILLKGGSSSSKSYTVAQAITTDSIQHKTNTLAFRKESTEISDTIFSDFTDVMSKFENHLPVRTIQNYKYIGQSKIRFRGLDKATKIKGLSMYQRLFVDEISEFYKKDWDEMKRRLRGRPNQQFIVTWNPVSAESWLKKELDLEVWIEQPLFIKDIKYSQLDKEHAGKWLNKTGDMLLINTTYRDNYWIVGHPDYSNVGMKDEHALEEFRRMKENNPDDYEVFGLGNWGTISQRKIFNPLREFDGIPEDARRIPSGMDFGFSPDPVTLTDFYLWKEYLIMDERVNKTNLVNVKIEGSEMMSIQDELEIIGFPKDRTIVADSAGTVSIKELRAAGYSIHAVQKGLVKEGLKTLRSYKLGYTKGSDNVKREFNNYLYKEDRNGVIIPEPMDNQSDHHIDPARYVLKMKDLLWV